MITDSQFTLRIKEARKIFTVKTISDKTGFTTQKVKDWEKGKNIPSSNGKEIVFENLDQMMDTLVQAQTAPECFYDQIKRAFEFGIEQQVASRLGNSIETLEAWRDKESCPFSFTRSLAVKIVDTVLMDTLIAAGVIK